jgi:hypothetical protein
MSLRRSPSFNIPHPPSPSIHHISGLLQPTGNVIRSDSIHRRREVPNLEILDTNVAFQIGVDFFVCLASHPILVINPNWYFNPYITPKLVRNT